jgi:hypothetical protein
MAQKEEGTKLQFSAEIKDVKLDMGTDYGNAGGFILSLKISAPKRPMAPSQPYMLREGPPQMPERGDQNDKAWKKVEENYQRQLSDFNRLTLRNEADQAEYREKLAALRDRQVAYMTLLGLAGGMSALGAKTVDVVLRPADTDLLPGFTALLLGEGAS